MSLTHSQTPFRFSFHNVTFPSPQLTARILPAKDHETRQTTSGNFPGAEAPVVGEAEPAADGSSAVFTQGEVGPSLVQMSTVLSCFCMSRGLQTFSAAWNTHLRRGSNVTSREADIWSPSNIAHPICMPFKYLLLYPRLRILAVSPDLDEVVASSTGKALHSLSLSCLTRKCVCGLRRYERARLNSRSPGYGVAANSMANEHVRAPLTII